MAAVVLFAGLRSLTSLVPALWLDQPQQPETHAMRRPVDKLRILELHAQHVRNCDIATSLGCSRQYVSRVIGLAFERGGHHAQ